MSNYQPERRNLGCVFTVLFIMISITILLVSILFFDLDVFEYVG